MQKSSTRPNGWVLTDTENGIVVTFDDGKFNDTQKVTPLDDVNHTPAELARIMRELGEWAVRHHGVSVLIIRMVLNIARMIPRAICIERGLQNGN